MEKQKVLITGASGFIGRNLFETLSKRDDLDVYGTYHSRRFCDSPKLIQADLRSRDTALKVTAGVDILIQAAATTSGAKDTINKPYYHVTDNAIINALLYEAAHENHIKQAIFFSCTTIYPNIDRPVTENDVDLNDGIYDKYFGVGWTKIYVEKLCQFYSKLGRTKYTVIRHSNIYGPYDKYDLERSHVFGATITKVMTSNDKITVWGEGKEERDLLHVNDLVNFIELVLARQDYDFDIFNIGLGYSVPIRDLVKKITDFSGKKLKIVYDTSKPSIATKLSVDFSKAEKKFGWKPKIDLDLGIKLTIDWYKANLTGTN